MEILKKDLQSLEREIKALSGKMEKLIKEFDKSKKTRAEKKISAKTVKAKTTKKASAKKGPVKKKTAKLTATDKVLKIVKGSKRGVNAATLVKKTGFDLNKVRNIIHRTHKQGKIKRVGIGVYIAA